MCQFGMMEPFLINSAFFSFLVFQIFHLHPGNCFMMLAGDWTKSQQSRLFGWLDLVYAF